MVGGAVTGAMSMALHAGSKAPHGGIFVFFAMDNFLWFVVSILVGMVVACAGVVGLKRMAVSRTPASEAVAAA